MKLIAKALGRLKRGKQPCAVLALCAGTAVALSAQTFTTLHSFVGTDGEYPAGVLIQGSDGNFYGTTGHGGANNDAGTVYKITPGGALTTLYNFCALVNSNTCADGKAPVGLVQAAKGEIYGTTSYGGSANNNGDCSGLGCGTIFEITPSGALTTLYAFCAQPVPVGGYCTDGAFPQAAPVLGADGNFYGTTASGGASGSGTVFKITPGGTLTTLYDFCGTYGFCTDGGSPAAALVQGADGNFYGTTALTIFKITPGGTLTTLYTFCYECVGGSLPALVQGADGNLYGTTGLAIFKITPGGTLTTLYTLQDSLGAEALIQGTDGNFYGTTFLGVFKMTPGGTLTTLYTFCSQSVNGVCSDGDEPAAALTQGTDGNFYGTTMDGGASCNCGNVFSLSVGLAPFVETLPVSGAVGTAVQILGANLTAATSVTFNGIAAVFTVVSSTLITATVPAGASTGSVQVMTPGGTLLGNVAFVVQASPPSTVAISGQVTLYGNGLSGATITLTGSPSGPSTTTTDASGDYSFSVASGGAYTVTPSLGNDSFVPSSQTFTNLSASETQNFTTMPSLATLYNFCEQPVNGVCPDGASPGAALVQGTDGNFYGTTLLGGANSAGTVFRLTPSGTLTTLYNFCSQGGATCTDGSGPVVLVLATDGNIYGATQGSFVPGCPTGDCGTVFKITPSGTLTTLYGFCSQSGCPDGGGPKGLIQASDGNFYGTTGGGGANKAGTVFKIAPTGTLTTLYSFCSQSGCADGGSPNALIQATDGNFYGTTGGGGANEAGTVFKITPTGMLTTLYSFCPEGACVATNPQAALVQGADGDFYGTAVSGTGTVFKITPAGALTTLHNFCTQTENGGVCTDGFDPAAPMIRGSDGNLYGTTAVTVFKITPDGTFTTLVDFCTVRGCAYPGVGALTQGSDGNLYAATSGLGNANCSSQGCGMIFSLSVGLAPFVETLPTSGAVGTTVQILGTNLTGSTSVTFNGTAAAFTVESSTLITTTVPSGASTGQVQVTTPSGTLLSNVAFIIGQIQPPPTVTISGQVTLAGSGLSGVTMTLTGSPSGPATATTDASGNYTFSVAAGGSYTLTPSLSGDSFTPASQTFTNLSANQTQDFVAVEVSAGNTLTVSLAYQFGSAFSGTPPAGAGFTVTPHIPGFTFDPFGSQDLLFQSWNGSLTANFAGNAYSGMNLAGSMPHLASGGGQWTTTFTLLNNGAAPANVALYFFDDHGNPLPLPLTFPQGSPGQTTAAFTGVLAAGAGLVIETAGLNDPLATGWAQLLSDGDVSGFAVFTDNVTASQQQQAVVPLQSLNLPAYVLWFDNTNGFATGVALANESAATASMTAVIRDDTGAAITTQTIQLPPNGHTAFVLATNYPATANRRGSVEFDEPANGQVSVLGLSFNPASAFTSIPVAPLLSGESASPAGATFTNPIADRTPHSTAPRASGRQSSPRDDANSFAVNLSYQFGPSLSGTPPAGAGFTVTPHIPGFTITPFGSQDLAIQNWKGTLAFNFDAIAYAGMNFAGSMPHLASGGGQWTTTFTILNAGSSTASIALNFFDDSGVPLQLPLIFPQGSPNQTTATFTGSVKSGAGLVIQTAGLNNPLATGWAQLLSDGDVSGFAVFTDNVTARQQQQAVVPLQSLHSSAYELWFDNTNGFATGVALANESTAPATMTLVIRDDTGAQIATQTIQLPAQGHTAFALATNYPMTANRRGTVEFSEPADGQVSVLGLSFNPASAFTSIPAVPQ
ncbi:MAG: choice-of-anchor tandem repeat GloVer-containing protein [Bryobacteraceae bacterium]|jgi:uncharacterized repeat protein (TIGR03803 family)